jgi:hypothetical protein
MKENNMPELKEHKELESQERQVYDIDGVEIFSAGKWNGDEYTDSDLDDMVNNFSKLKGRVKPFIKLGHDENQKLLQKDGLPAAGWVTDLKRNGSKLVAKFSNVPKKIHDLIKNKAYGRFSSEIYWNLKNGSDNHKRVLKGVALLGGDTPAVSNLDDFINLYELNDLEELKSYSINEDRITVEEVKTCTDIDTEIVKEDSNMSEIKELEQKIESLEKQYTEDVESKDNQIKELSEKLEAVESEKLASVKNAHIEKAENYIQAKVKDETITPAQGKWYTSLALADVIDANEEGVKSYSYKEGDEDKVVEFKDNLELVQNIIDNNAEIDTEEKTNKSEPDSEFYTEENNEKDLDEKDIKDYCDKNELNYKDHKDYRQAVMELKNGGKE